MSSITNLRRDMKWIGEPTNMAAGSANTALNNVMIRTDNTLNVRHGYMQTGLLNLAGGAGSWYGFGLYMQWKQLGPTPYRIKAFCSVEAHWGFGWRDAVAEFGTPGAHRFCDIGKRLDEVWCIRERTSWADHNLLFYGMIPADAGECVLDMSVQALWSKPDGYSSEVY